MPVWVNSEMPPSCQCGKLTKLPIMPHLALTMPMVFGPANRRFPARACCPSTAWSARPDAPASAKPAVMMQAARTPAAMHWPTASGTRCRGSTM